MTGTGPAVPDPHYRRRAATALGRWLDELAAEVDAPPRGAGLAGTVLVTFEVELAGVEFTGRLSDKRIHVFLSRGELNLVGRAATAGRARATEFRAHYYGFSVLLDPPPGSGS